LPTAQNPAGEWQLLKYREFRLFWEEHQVRAHSGQVSLQRPARLDETELRG
jgi:hypothetical protein